MFTAKHHKMSMTTKLYFMFDDDDETKEVFADLKNIFFNTWRLYLQVKETQKNPRCSY